ncbi:hypothetical protein DL93DRAFT_1601310 [Clavulina sp. PMI_390]|nr:hypothetical protein DL93DRAFT_1601310 [Clavulina sp. PMI_390]
MAFVAKLPNEILLHIFECTVATSVTDRASGAHYKTMRALLSITTVCRRWRNAAIACRSLWCDIYVGPSNFDDPSSQSLLSPGQFGRVEALLERSGSLPISLLLGCIASEDLVEERLEHLPEFVLLKAEHQDDTLRKIMESQWRQMLKTLHPHINRCIKLVIFHDAEYWDVLHDFTEIAKTSPLSMLKHLEVEVIIRAGMVGDEGAFVLGRSSILTSDLPLETLKFRHYSAYLPIRLDAPWPSLKSPTWDITDEHRDRIPDTLSLFPSLEYLSLTLSWETTSGRISPFHHSSELIVMPSLRTVVTDSILFWSIALTPHVSEVTIRCPSLDVNHDSTTKALKNLPTSAKKLHLRATWLDAKEPAGYLTELFSGFAGVTELEIEWYGINLDHLIYMFEPFGIQAKRNLHSMFLDTQVEMKISFKLVDICSALKVLTISHVGETLSASINSKFSGFRQAVEAEFPSRRSVQVRWK